MQKPSPISPPEACERLEDLLPRFGGAIRFLPGDKSASYVLPADSGNGFREFFLDSCSVSPEKNYIAYLARARVFGSGNVLSPDGKSIARDVSLDFGKGFDEHWLRSFTGITSPVFLPGTSAVIASTLGFGYSHWLLEELPRLLLIKDEPFGTLIAHSLKEYNRQALALAGFSGKLLEPRRLSHWDCENLFIPGLVGKAGFPHSRTVDLLNGFVEPLRQSKPYYPDKIYLSRQKAKRRRIENEAALVEVLQEKGFSRIFAEDLTWKEQINLFTHSRAVVSPHGAALANLVFCRPGTKVVELFNRSYLNGCYWRLSSINHLDYTPLFPTEGAPLSDERSNNKLDLTAPIQKVLETVG